MKLIISWNGVKNVHYSFFFRLFCVIHKNIFIKTLGSLWKVRVGRVTGSTGIFFLGLTQCFWSNKLSLFKHWNLFDIMNESWKINNAMSMEAPKRSKQTIHWMMWLISVTRHYSELSFCHNRTWQFERMTIRKSGQDYWIIKIPVELDLRIRQQVEAKQAILKWY